MASNFYVEQLGYSLYNMLEMWSELGENTKFQAITMQGEGCRTVISKHYDICCCN